MHYKERTILLVMLSFVLACNDRSERKTADQDEAHRVQMETVKYTCPMHPRVQADEPGACPVCGMKLVPAETGRQKKGDTLQWITLSERQQFLGNIHTDTASLAALSDQRVLTGTTLFDPRRTKVVSARVSGWIQQMYVRSPGEWVAAGQKLYALYSPALLSAEKDYLLALQQKKDTLNSPSSPRFRQELAAALNAIKQKLFRWGLTESQVEEIQKKPPGGTVTVYSKTAGYLIGKVKEEGDHVDEGETILHLVENDTLWVRAQLYDNEWPVLQDLEDVKVEIKGFGKKLSGKVVFNNPVNKGESRVHLLTIAIVNATGKLQPGMLAYVYLHTSEKQPGVVIPKSAVVYGTKKNHVWVKQPGSHSTGSSRQVSRFERRAVVLGESNQTSVRVLQGIKPGELVVSSGGYLVNSEYILRHGNGVNLSGMQRSDMRMKGKSQE